MRQLAIMTIISKCTASALKDAAASLLAGNLVAFPTETVYGLGADACNIEAVARIYEIKGRPMNGALKPGDGFIALADVPTPIRAF